MAPQYRKTSRYQKTRVLNAFVTVTGYSRTYAVQILNHPESLKAEIQRPRPARSCTEVQQALFLTWRAANQICAKRLIPFLPTLVSTPWSGKPSASDGGVPQATTLHERNHRRSLPPLSTKKGSSWHLDHANGNLAQKPDSHPHICRLE